MLHVRPYVPADRAFVLSLAERLTTGMPAWRDPALWGAAVHGWVESSIDNYPQRTMVFIAEDERGEPLGFATVSHDRHFSGERQAYMGELVTSSGAEGRGVGTALVQACEEWARDQGYQKLAVSTGAANSRALGLYHQLGFGDEDIKLVKLL
jgi:GNAT superfamily N-acetyltransferase